MSPPDLLDPSDVRPAARRALCDWLALQRALALEPVQAARLLAAHGAPGAALRAAGEPRPDAASLDADVAALRRAGALALPLGAPAYPERLAALTDPAPLLAVRGDPACLSRPAVAVVGARAASDYGRAVARRLSGELAAAGLVVVSGLARGVDAAAHEGALEAGGLTVAVQACGIDRVYPAAHRRLAGRIAASGAVITEHAPGVAPLPAFFPLRNRLISGLALALVVVEARERSGSLTTAGPAAAQDVDVFAVPGRVDAPGSAGPLRLLSEGAYVARSSADVLALLAHRGSFRPCERPPDRAAAAALPDSPLVRALRQAPASRDELARRLGQPPASLARELLELELAGALSQDRSGRLHLSEP